MNLNVMLCKNLQILKTHFRCCKILPLNHQSLSFTEVASKLGQLGIGSVAGGAHILCRTTNPLVLCHGARDDAATVVALLARLGVPEANLLNSLMNTHLAHCPVFW